MFHTAQFGLEDSRFGRIVFGCTQSWFLAQASSSLSLESTAQCAVDYLTAFDRVLAAIGLSNDNQGEFALVHALLQYATSHQDRNDVHDNPFREVLRRLEAESLNPHALENLRRFFNSAIAAYDRSATRPV